MLENKETSPSSSQAKATSKKRRLEVDEDSLTELGSGQAISVTSVGSSVAVNSETAPPLSKATNKKRRLEEDIPTEQVFDQIVAVTSSVPTEILLEDREPTPLARKDHHLDNEPLASDSSSQVQDTVEDDTRDSSINSITAAAPATLTAALPISTPPPTSISHVTSVQVSAPVTDLRVESSSRDTAPNLTLPSPPLAEALIEKSDTNTRPSKRARLDIEPTATHPVPTSSITLESTASLAVVIPDVNITLQTNALLKPSPLVVLPVELLSEILIYTASPQHVLAVARTCKALCQTLLSTNNQFIWKLARKACVFKALSEPTYLPDPPQEFFGEAAYAAFIFDLGTCDVSLIFFILFRAMILIIC
jgi:hypothetical protein